MKEFTTAATRGKPGVGNPVPIEFKVDDDVLTARAPTTGQVALFISHGRGGGIASIESLFEFFSDILDDDDWKVMEGKLRDGMDVELLAEISNYLIGEWSGRPTSSPPPHRLRGTVLAEHRRRSRLAWCGLHHPPARSLLQRRPMVGSSAREGPGPLPAELERPIVAGAAVSDQDLERDETNFMAFASAFGIKPPSPPPDEATA